MTNTDTAEAARQTLETALKSVRPIVTMSRDELVVIALAATNAAPVDYLTLADTDAPPVGFEVTELGSGGSVPTVQVRVGQKPLLVIAGETIIGGKQNRVINVSLWLGPLKVTPIPVTCLEHGRWNAGYRFGAGPTVDLDFRAKMSGMVNRHARAGRAGFHSDQAAVWNEIAAKEQLHARRSATGALHDLYASEPADIGAMVRAFPLPDGASGVAFGIGGKLLALDLFDAPATLQRQWQRLITSAVTALIDHRQRVARGWLPKPEHRYPDEGALGRMLGRALEATADAMVRPSVGEGWDMRLQTKKLHGSALVADSRAVHVALFRDDAPPPPPPAPSGPPAPRRRERPVADRPVPPAQRTRRGIEDLLREMGGRNAVGEPPQEPPVAVPAGRPRHE